MENAEKIFTRCEQEGFSYIQQMIIKQQEENIFLTFKRKTDYTNSILSKDDKKNYEKNVSFFSHVSGGVIIWGVASSKNIDGVNIAKKIQPISNGKAFLSNLNCLFPKDFIAINPDVKNIYIPFPKETNNGFVITYVPGNNYLLSLNNYYTKTRDNFVMMMGQILLNDVLKNRRL
ncbi:MULTISPECIES: hypothetical protein [Bacillus]|uniref:Schlafen AlbA-2 domain-containing protein n=1 Tax=Bacillus mycoides TaxID=1405 RepID=A0A1D3MN73_BACMY|nr:MULTISPECIES: hypothetical protein [Bacillus cereus group]MBJ8009540.1 hypothetical protein [Bacillus cereus]MBJ8072687.1 hypothetical protein [Bacillus cereus]MBJ8189693.1 hypothetical protein [Bacillus cereus]MCQ6358814.1 hypothetical protein [Bacillus cereus]MDM5460290.1 hypothetical protein [Bacillus cereus]